MFGEPNLTPVMSPARNRLQHIDPDSPKANESKRKFFHSIVMLLRHVLHLGRRDMQLEISFLFGRANFVTELDYKNLRSFIRHIIDSINELLFLGDTDMEVLLNFVDASYRFHNYFKSHMEAATTFGCFFSSMSSKKI